MDPGELPASGWQATRPARAGLDQHFSVVRAARGKFEAHWLFLRWRAAIRPGTHPILNYPARHSQARADRGRAPRRRPAGYPARCGPRARARIVCNCFDVAENEIRADLAAGLDLAALTEKSKCGSSCGSCRPELRRMAADAGMVVGA
jgi:bacterioferritin-associated ferredoxin